MERQHLMCSGDIVLVSGSKRDAKPNLAGQSLSRLSIARFSHIAIVHSVNLIFHADLSPGVEYKFTPDFLLEYDLKYRAFRHEKIHDWACGNPAEFHASLCHFIGQEYIAEIRERSNLNLGIKKLKNGAVKYGETFCSMLVNDFLKQNFPELALDLKAPYPIDFERAFRSAEWTDVTELHLRVQKMNIWDRNIFDGVVSGVEALRKGIQEQDKIKEMLNSLTKFAQAIEKAHGVSMPFSKETWPIEAGPIDFWDQKYGKKPKKKD